jgi:hypothetical protein
MGKSKAKKDKRSKQLKRRLEELPDWKKKQRQNIKPHATVM